MHKIQSLEISVSLSCCVCVMRGWPRVGCCYLANIVRQPIHPWTTTNAEFSLVSSDISTDSRNTVFEQICFFPRTMWNFRIQFLVTEDRFEMFFWLEKSVWLYDMYKMCWKFLCVLPTFVTISTDLPGYQDFSCQDIKPNDFSAQAVAFPINLFSIFVTKRMGMQ